MVGQGNRVKLQCSVLEGDSFFEPFKSASQEFTVRGIGIRLVWIEFDSSLEFLFGPGKVPVGEPMNLCQCQVCVGQRSVERQGLQRRIFGLRHSFEWGHVSVRYFCVDVCQVRISERILWVEPDGPIEKIYSFFATVLRGLVKKVTAFQVRLVRIWRWSVLLSQLLSLLICQPKAQLA